MTKTYQNRKTAGVCVKCGKEPAINGKVRGEICAEIDSDWSAGKRDIQKVMTEQQTTPRQ